MASSFTRDDSPWFWLRVKDAQGFWQKVRTNIRRGDPDGERKLRIKLGEAEVAEAQMMLANGRAPDMRGWGWVSAYLVQHYAKANSLKRAQNCWAAVRVFLDFRQITDPAQVTHAHGHDYVNFRTNPPAKTLRKRSKNNALTEIKIWGGIMQHAVRCGMIPANPLYRLGIKRDKAKVKPEITREEQAQIEKALADEPGWMADSWMVAMKQGSRRSQAQIPMKDICEAQMMVTLPEQKGKQHSMPLHPDLLPLVKRRRAEGAEYLVEYPAQITGAWSKFFAKIGLPHLCYHCTRVTVITRLLRAGYTPALVMAWVGHSSESVNMIYRRLKAPDVAQLGDVL